MLAAVLKYSVLCDASLAYRFQEFSSVFLREEGLRRILYRFISFIYVLYNVIVFSFIL
jgi:hypothetical protein